MDLRRPYEQTASQRPEGYRLRTRQHNEHMRFLAHHTPWNFCSCSIEVLANAGYRIPKAARAELHRLLNDATPDDEINYVSEIGWHGNTFICSAPGSLDTSLSHAAGLIEIAACHA